MSLVSDALGIGASALRDAAGELVTFRDEDVLATVNWTPKPDPGSDTDLDRSVQSKTEIEIDSAALDDAPAPGEVITTADDRKHRIQTVTWNSDGWICRCEVSGP